MLLTPDGHEVGRSDPLTVLLKDPCLQQANTAFLSSNKHVIPKGTRALCIVQGEQARLQYGDSSFLLGSEDATTCMILVLRCPVTRTAWAAHVDDGSAPVDKSLLDIACAMQQPELYLVGCYKEYSGVSMKVIAHMMYLLTVECPARITVKLACVYEANTLPNGFPASRQLAVDCLTGEASPAVFEERGPVLPRRFAAHQFSSGHLVRICDGSIINIPAIDVSLPSCHIMRLERIAALDDDRFLLNASTSPAHEGPNFVQDIKGAYTWLIHAQDQPYQPEMWFAWSQDRGCWEETPRPTAVVQGCLRSLSARSL